MKDSILTSSSDVSNSQHIPRLLLKCSAQPDWAFAFCCHHVYNTSERSRSLPVSKDRGFPPWEAASSQASTRAPRAVAALPDAAEGRSGAILLSRHPLRRAPVRSPAEWLTGWVCFHASVSGNNDRNSETSLKPERRGLTFSTLVSVGRLKWSGSNF